MVEPLMLCLFGTGDRPGSVAATGLERAVRPQRRSVFNASARSAAAGCRRSTCQSHGCRQSRRVHGPHTYLPGAGGKTQSFACGLRRIQLPQSTRPL